MNQTSALDGQVAFLKRQRWFQHKGESLERVELVDEVRLSKDVQLGLFRFHFAGAEPALYLVPFSEKDGSFEDTGESFARDIFGLFEKGAVVGTRGGELVLDIVGDRIPPNESFKYKSVALNTSNSILFRMDSNGPRHIVKVMRRINPGKNIEAAINKHLFTRTSFRHSPAFHGALLLRLRTGEELHLANLFDYQKNDGDAWDWALGWLGRLIEAGVKDPEQFYLRSVVRRCEEDVAPVITSMGRALADLHQALASGPEPFIGRPIEASDIKRLRDGWLAQHERVMGILSDGRGKGTKIEFLPSQGKKVVAIFDRAAELLTEFPCKVRQHGDFHLVQVLVDGSDCSIIDYEGEPLKSSSEREAYYPPIKDIAGMLRSFNYSSFASFFAARDKGILGNESAAALSACRLFERFCCEVFQSSWHKRLVEVGYKFLPPDGSAALKPVLKAFMLDKALYETEYEVNNRPDWLEIPASGINGILEA